MRHLIIIVLFILYQFSVKAAEYQRIQVYTEMAYPLSYISSKGDVTGNATKLVEHVLDKMWDASQKAKKTGSEDNDKIANNHDDEEENEDVNNSKV